VLREIFGPKREEVKGDWRKLHNIEHVAGVVRREQSEDCGEEKTKGTLARPRAKWEDKFKINRKGTFFWAWTELD
jgi:hypothetical protein